MGRQPYDRTGHFEQDVLPKPILSIQTITTFDGFLDFEEKHRML